MSEQLFDIVFRGDIVIGHNIAEVKQRLGQLFKIDGDKVNALFTGRAVPLKRNVDAATAQKYQATIVKAGAQVEICPAGGVKPAPGNGPAAAPRAAAPGSQSVTSQPLSSQPLPSQSKTPLTLKERLAQQAAQEQATARQAKPAKPAPPKPAAPVSSVKAPDFELAPVGADLSPTARGKPQQPAQVDTSALSIRPQEGDLLDSHEKTLPVAATVEAGEYDVADVGADLLRPAERKQIKPLEVDVSGYDIADVGADLLEAGHKLPIPELDIDTSVFDLAPVGSDLGQQRKAAPPPPPDTSALSLSD